jgi:hypothetical protein
MANKHVWASAFFMTGVVVIVGGVGIAASPARSQWGSPLVIVMLMTGALMLTLASSIAVVIWRSRPRLTFHVGKLECASFQVDGVETTAPCHFMRIWVQNEGRDLAQSV